MHSTTEGARAAPFPIAEALAAYIAGHSRAIGRAQIERQLAARLLDAAEGLAVPDLPVALLGSHSGAALQWAISQATRRPDLPRGSLADAPAIAEQPALLLARAWAHWPANPRLDPARRHDLAAWLARYPAARFWVALALADSAEPAAAAHARRWLDSAPAAALQPDQIAALLHRPALRAPGAIALRRAALYAAADQQASAQFCALAAAARLHAETVALASTFVQSFPGHPQAGAIDALRIAALAETAPEAALALYRRRWYAPRSPEPFAAPQALLPLLDRPGTADLRAFLLGNCRAGPELPRWVALEQHELHAPPEATLPAWMGMLAALLARQTPAALLRSPRARHILVRATLTALRLGPQRAAQIWPRLAQIWRAAGVGHSLARAALLLLDPEPARQIAAYEAGAPWAPAEDLLSARAEAAYVAALCRLRRWATLNRHTAQQADLLIGPVFSHKTMRFFTVLRQIEAERAAGRSGSAWLAAWEILVSMPQLDFQVEATLAYFLASKRWLSAGQRTPPDGARFVELTFHVERLAKALGERRLSAASLAEPERQRRSAALDQAGLADLPAMLAALTIVDSQ